MLLIIIEIKYLNNMAIRIAKYHILNSVKYYEKIATSGFEKIMTTVH